MQDFTSVAMLILDVAVIGALGLALWRFGRDPSAAWADREVRLTKAVEGLQALVGEAESQAQAIDAQLAGRLAELRGLLADSAQTATPAPSEVPATGGTAGLRRQIQDLVQRGTSVEEIARQVEMPVAEVRLLVGMQGGRGARGGRRQPGKNVAAKTAA